MIQGTSLDAEECERRLKTTNSAVLWSHFTDESSRRVRKTMTQTGEPNSIRESPVLIMHSDRSKMKDISIRPLINWKQRQNRPKQNETKQKSQQKFLL